MKQLLIKSQHNSAIDIVAYGYERTDFGYRPFFGACNMKESDYYDWVGQHTLDDCHSVCDNAMHPRDTWDGDTFDTIYDCEYL